MNRALNDCVFCKIVAGELPAYRVYEDDAVLAFLDIQPVARGHTLVIPKAHHARVDGMPPELAGRCAEVVAKLAPKVLAAVGAGAWNLLQNNGRDAHQAVDHVHFHIIPRLPNAPSSAFHFNWPAGKLDAKEAAALVERVQS